jgi:mono/diheme cytochrome c family protein
MVHSVLPMALAGVVIAAPFAWAEGKIALKSVTVDLPAGDRLFPDGPHADAVNNNCLACHSAGMVLNQPALSKAQWEAEVNKMRTAYKAPIDSKDIDEIVDYLVSRKAGMSLRSQ